MAHIFDVMSTICGNLNSIYNQYDGKGSFVNKLPNVPNIVMVCANRALDSNSNIATIDFTIRAKTGDPFSQVYLSIAEGIDNPVVDKVPFKYTDVKPENDGVGLAYIIIVPRKIFDENTTINEIARILKDIYFEILNFDHDMKYKAEPAILALADSDKVKIPTYDVMMIYIALGFANINLRSWYTMDGRNPVGPEYTLQAFTEKELPEKYRNKIIKVLKTHATKIGILRDSLSGNLLFDTM